MAIDIHHAERFDLVVADRRIRRAEDRRDQAVDLAQIGHPPGAASQLPEAPQEGPIAGDLVARSGQAGDVLALGLLDVEADMFDALGGKEFEHLVGPVEAVM